MRQGLRGWNYGEFMKEKLERIKREKQGWALLAENSMNKIWNNSQDDEVWNEYSDSLEI